MLLGIQLERTQIFDYRTLTFFGAVLSCFVYSVSSHFAVPLPR